MSLDRGEVAQAAGGLDGVATASVRPGRTPYMGFVFFVKNISFMMQRCFLSISQCNFTHVILFSIPLLQSLFRAWLAEKEEALNQVQTSNFKDPSEMNTNVRQLAVSCVRFLYLS